MTSCERAQSLFGPGWDDELSVVERESLERHFIECPGCRRDYDEFARTLELVQSLPRPQVSGDFATRVLAEARRREAENGRSFAARSGWFARPAALAFAATLFILAGVGGFLIARHPLIPGAPAPQVAQSSNPSPNPGSNPAVPRAAGDPDVPVTTGPTPGDADAGTRVVAPPATTMMARATSPHRTRSSQVLAAVPDSIFDHSADVEFVLDPVKLRRERGRGYTPVPTSVRGETASITF